MLVLPPAPTQKGVLHVLVIQASAAMESPVRVKILLIITTCTFNLITTYFFKLIQYIRIEFFVLKILRIDYKLQYYYYIIYYNDN